MRKFAAVLATAGLILGLGWAAIMSASPAGAASGDPEGAVGSNPRYYTIQSKLDQGGSFYLYADVRDDLKNLMVKIQAMMPSSGLPPEAAMPISLVAAELEHSGIYGVQDIGISSMPENGRYLNKLFINVPLGRTGLLALLGGPAHPITALEYAPADTQLFNVSEFEAAGLLKFVRDAIRNVGGEAALSTFNQQLAASSTQTGMDFEAIINAFSGQFCVVGTLDPAQKLTIPAQGPGAQPIQIDAPKVAIIIDTKDSSLYDALKALLDKSEQSEPETEIESLKLTAIKVPQPDPNYEVSPAFASDAGHFYFTSHVDYLKKVLEAKKAGGGLAQTEEYKALSAGTPSEGNTLTYVSDNLAQTYSKVIQDMMSAMPGENRAEFQTILNMMGEPRGSFGISCNQTEGILTVSRSSNSGSGIVIAASSAPIVAILAAIAVPNFLEAQSRSKISRVKADMRSMATALEAYYIDNNAYPAPDNLKGLTTPVAYMTSFFADPFAQPGDTFHYFSTTGIDKEHPGWILWSPGPDAVYNILPENMGSLYDPTAHERTAGLVDLTYDPTNGTVSSGDVARIKQ